MNIDDILIAEFGDAEIAEARRTIAPIEAAGVSCRIFVREDRNIEAEARRTGEKSRLAVAGEPHVGTVANLARSLVMGARKEGWIDLGPYRIEEVSPGNFMLYDAPTEDAPPWTADRPLDGL